MTERNEGQIMSTNEFVLGLVGVVIGLGLADLLTSFHKLLRAGSRVQWDWLTIAYAVMMLYSLIVFWWWQFGFPGDGVALTIAGFLPNFIFLALTFLMVASALPDEVPAEGLSLRVFYLESLRHRWGLLTVSLIYAMTMNIFGIIDRKLWQLLWWEIPTVASVVLAALAIRIRATWFQALAITWIIAVTSYFNLFKAVGP
ncbi:MAG: hypothetical protein ACKO01_13105 [Erythrobacter sp.]